MTDSKPIDFGRKKLMKEKGLTEQDAEELRQLIIDNQIAWVRKLRAEGKEVDPQDLQWLRDRGIDPDTI